ncbi:hypothetical protein LTR78_006170 [Recurvomyces mirabilis]|uniref:Uncharacterized protein n=1 Tax=Recurvomyces mirabilis TaxID=574656 RepID=A0AAE0WLK4_9PEZI|nr:hypothetical protein LTR78_006170 [Recurvomyces mirabilis]KAK5152012.1 hypothetical protein LTS14_008786 [Recurvomyces mirabilis]
MDKSPAHITAAKPARRATGLPTKKACIEARQRKRFYRAGSLFQQMLYIFREAGFEHRYHKVEKTKGGILHVYKGLSPDDKIPTRFPERMISDERDKHALLAYHACNDPVTYLYDLMVKVFRGTLGSIREAHIEVHEDLERVVEHMVPEDGEAQSVVDSSDEEGLIYQHQIVIPKLKNGERYVLDAAGAQYGQYRAVMPYESYDQSFVKENIATLKFGSLLAKLRAAIALATARDAANDVRLAFVEFMMGEAVARIVKEWEASAGSTICEMLDEPHTSYLASSTALLDFARSGLIRYVHDSELDGTFHFVPPEGIA